MKEQKPRDIGHATKAGRESRGETEVIRTTVHLKTGWCMLKSEFGIVAAGAGTPNKIKTGSIPSKTGGAPGRAMERKR